MTIILMCCQFLKYKNLDKNPDFQLLFKKKWEDVATPSAESCRASLGGLTVAGPVGRAFCLHLAPLPTTLVCPMPGHFT